MCRNDTLRQVAADTLKTLGVLFPRSDPIAAKWFKQYRKRSKPNIDPKAGDCQGESIEMDSFWLERLLVLEKAFNHSEPSTLSQWWYDDRKRREWATFWVAFVVLMLTIISLFLTVIQTISGVIGAWAAVKALK